MRDNVDGVHTATPLNRSIYLLITRDSLVRRGPRPPNDVGGRVDYLRECFPATWSWAPGLSAHTDRYDAICMPLPALHRGHTWSPQKLQYRILDGLGRSSLAQTIPQCP